MSPSRRMFLRMAGASALAAAAGCSASGSGGRRLAMVIDARACAAKEGCRACIDACHRAHNVPSIPEPRHAVKWVWKERVDKVLPEAEPLTLPAVLRDRDVLVFCNHCDNPPCVRVCPTGATWKREDGIVSIDEHRCIGCRYCVAACPYGSRSFNWVDPRPHLEHLEAGYPTRTIGVVEKCNFCEERVPEGQPPACVAACPEHALVFGNLNDAASAVRARLASGLSLRRKPELGTRPQLYYLVSREEA